jgi:hypothetical protein
VLPPGSLIGPITPAQRQTLLQGSLVAGVYEKVVDRDSAYERLRAHAGATGVGSGDSANTQGATTAGASGATAPAGGDGGGNAINELLFGRTGPRGGQHDGLVQTLAKTVVRQVGSSIGRQLVRGVLGSLLGGRR